MRTVIRVPYQLLLLISGSTRGGSTNAAVFRTAQSDGSSGSIYRKPVAWINASSPASTAGGAGAHDTLSSLLGYVGVDIVHPACGRLLMSRDAIGENGLVIAQDANHLISRVVRRPWTT